MPVFSQFLIIFLNNSFTAFLIIILGIVFGIFPFLALFSNGLLLGIVVYFAQTTVNWLTIFALIFPHGIIEIPAIILASAIGFKLGKNLFDKIFKKQANISIKQELNIALIFFLKLLLPVLAIAAAIEVLVYVKFI